MDYRFTRGSPQPGERYFLVLLHDSRDRTESAVLMPKQSGTLNQTVRLIGRPVFRPGGRGLEQSSRIEIFMEKETVEAGKARRERVSNTVTLP